MQEPLETAGTQARCLQTSLLNRLSLVSFRYRTSLSGLESRRMPNQKHTLVTHFAQPKTESPPGYREGQGKTTSTLENGESFSHQRCTQNQSRNNPNPEPLSHNQTPPSRGMPLRARLVMPAGWCSVNPIVRSTLRGIWLLVPDPLRQREIAVEHAASFIPHSNSGLRKSIQPTRGLHQYQDFAAVRKCSGKSARCRLIITPPITITSI